MALNFPSAPADGDVYDNWVYSSAKGAWLAKPLEPTTAVTSDTAPPNPIDGDMWFNTLDGTTYVYYDDGDTAQWVEMTAPVTANGYYSPNYIINGAFEINQRGFTSTTTNATFTLDRWRTNFDGGTVTYSAQAIPAGTISSPIGEAKNSLRIVTSGQSAAGNFGGLRYAAEDVRTLAGRVATISFWAKAASGTPKVGISFEQGFGSGGSSSVVKDFGTVNISTSWQRYSLTGQIPSVSGKTITANDVLGMNILVSTGSSLPAAGYSDVGIQNNTFDFWGVQLEEGTVATNFRRNANSLQGELSACRRYFQAGVPGGAGKINSSTVAQLSVAFTDLMRAAPSISQVATWQILNPGLAFHTVTATDVGGGSARGAVLTVTSSGMAAGAAVAAVPSEGSLWFSAEL